MFDRTERGFFAGEDVGGVVSTLQRALSAEELHVQQIAPAAWSGKSLRTSWFIAPRVAMTAFPTPQGFVLEVRVSADIEAGGAVLMVLSWFFCFPGAILMALLAHQDFARRQTEVFEMMLGQVRHLMIAPNFPPPFAGFPPGRR